MNENKSWKITFSCFPTFCQMLFIAFLVMKLAKIIDWSWWWVTSPIWIPSALFIVISIIILFARSAMSIRQ